MKKIILMKYGVHAKEEVESIIKRKQQEINMTGYCFWGYGGTLLHPIKKVQLFCKDEEVYVLFVKTKSEYTANEEESFYYAIDGISYQKIPSTIHVYGSKYALVLDDLQEYHKDINLYDYEVGIGNAKGENLSDYFRFRVDKVCAIKKNPSDKTKMIHVDYIAKLKTPYAVFIK